MKPSAIAMILLLILGLIARAADQPQPAKNDPPAKPKVAIFPLAGSTSEKTRDSIGYSMRMKLDRDGTYEAIDGPTMKDIAGEAKDPITIDTAADTIKALAKDSGAAVLVWGQLDAGGGLLGDLDLKILDLRQPDATPLEIHKLIAEPQDMRFVVEEVLKSLAGVKDFEHPSEEAVHHTPETDAAFAKNPNLVVNGDFKADGHWFGIYMANKWELKSSDQPPQPDTVVINAIAAGDGGGHMAAMNLSKECAENNGLACLSDAIAIKPQTRYRLTFRYLSDGPTTHVFIKGYANGKDIAGKDALREDYRCQVPPGDATHGKWVAVECDCNPQNTQHPVDVLKIDLYAYLKPGKVMFADVVLKEVGPQNPGDQMKDDAIRPATKPAK